MSACGFTWCYLAIYAFVATTFNLADPQFIEATFNLGYVMIIFPIIGSGMAIWAHSIIVAYRERSAANVGVAAWNTFAQAYNIYGAFRGLPDILKSLGNFLKGGDSKTKAIQIAIMALALGVLTTYVIIRWSARGYSQEMLRAARPSPA